MLSNAFSLNMLPSNFDGNIRVRPATLDEARAAAANSVVGHADTATVFASVLGTEVAYNRATVSLTAGSAMVVGQYRGPRLVEGATELPPGASVEWIHISLVEEVSP